MDIAQLPHLPEKTSESSETSDSESDSKDTSGITGTPPSPCSALTACLSKHEGWAVARGGHQSRATSHIKLILSLSLHTRVFTYHHMHLCTHMCIYVYIWYLYTYICHVYINICMCASYMYTDIQRGRPIKRPLHVGRPLATQKESCPDPLASFGLFTRSSLRALSATSKTVCIFEPQIVTSLPSWG